MKNFQNKQFVFALLLIVAVASRLIPHPANLIPLGAFAIFVGFKMGKAYALLLIASVMLITDLFLGFSMSSIFVYLGMAGYALASYLVKKNYFSIFLAAFCGSSLFFVVSNFGVWLGPWYPHTLSGLVSCFTLAIPFFTNTLIADIAFSGLTFGLFALYQKNKEGGLWMNIPLKRKELAWQTISKGPTLKQR